MPFNRAKQIVKKKIAPKVKEKGVLMKAAYQMLLNKFNKHTFKANRYLSNADYSGHNRDKWNYLAQIRKSTDGFLKKEGKMNEFLKYIVNVDKKSDRLHETMGRGIKQREKAKFNELNKKNIKLVREANFDDAIFNMQALNMHLSPFSRTDKSGNIGEPFLRLDKKIEEKVNNLKGQKKLHAQLFKKGNVFETKKEKIQIFGIMSGGKVKYADIKGKLIKELKPKDYKTVSWLALLRKFPPGKFELKKGGKNIDIKTDPDIAKSSAGIAELKMLKQINFFYSGGLEKFAKNPEEKKLLKAALEENLATMGLYFDRNADGTVTPTKIYKMLPQAMKVKKLVGMMQGFQRIRMRMKLEDAVGKIDKEKNPSQHRFFKAEIDFQNGLHLSAYAKFKKYVADNKTDTSEAVKKQVKHAQGRIRQSSFYVINLAQRYSMACVQEPTGNKNKFHLSDSFRKKIITKLSKVFNELRKSIQSGKAANLDQAYALLKNKPEGGLEIKIGEFGSKGNTEMNFLKKHYSFVKTMITSISILKYGDNQEKALGIFGDKARKDKYRGGARVLYEEQMKRKLLERRRELMKDPKYRAKERQRLLALTSGVDGRQIAFDKVTKMFAKDMEKKIPGITRVAGAVSNKLSAAKNLISDYFTETELNLEPQKEKKLSKYENISLFGDGAGIMRRAIHAAGGLGKYQALPLEKKKEFYEIAKMKILLAKHGNNEHKINVNAYVKSVMAEDGGMSQATNPVAYKFNDSFDPNNEFFNLSDEGWDFVESLVGEVPLMAASGGVGNVAALGVKQGAKFAVKKMAQSALKRTLQSTAFRLGVRGTAFVADLAVSEVVDRSMRYILRGEKPPTDIAQLLAHSIGTYGSMKYASKGGQRLLRGVAKQGTAGKIASHAISTAAIEAPCMVIVNNIFGQADGSMLEQYGRALGTMLASKGSMSMLSRSTGGAMMRAEQNYDVRESVNKIKDPWKKKVVSEMLRKNEIKTDQLSTILNSKLNTNQIIKLRSLINNPKSKRFLVAYKYAESHGIDNQDITHQYDYLVHQLMQEGLSRDDSKALLESVNERSLQQSVPTAAAMPASRSKTPTAKPKPSSKSERIKATPVAKIDQAKLKELASRLKKLGMDDLAYVMADSSMERIPVRMPDGGGKDIKTYEQRVAEVKRLEDLDNNIKFDTENLRGNGLNKEAKALEDYNNTSKYKSLEERQKVAQYLSDGVDNLNGLQLPFNSKNAVQIIDFMNAKSDAGVIFKRALVKMTVAKLNNDISSIKNLRQEIDMLLVQTFWNITPALRAKILDIHNKKLLKPEDREILETNRGKMTPELIDALVIGGQDFTIGGKTVRIFKGKQIGAGGLGVVHGAWFVQRPSKTIESGVVKIPREDAGLHFKYESKVAGELSNVFSKNPSESADHVIKPVFASPDIIIYKKIADVKGKSQSLHDAMRTMSTKKWLTQFTGGLKGLVYLHKNGITHNDFKPDNIVVGKNGGVLIDIGSFVLDKDVGKKILTLDTEFGSRGAFFKLDKTAGSISFTPMFHNPAILAKSIDSRKKGQKLPMDLGDKYSVGTSLLVMLTQKGYVSQPGGAKVHKFTLNPDAPKAVAKLYKLGIKLMKAPNHPHKYKRKWFRKVKDPGYISLKGAIKKIKRISSTLPDNDGAASESSSTKSFK